MFHIMCTAQHHSTLATSQRSYRVKLALGLDKLKQLEVFKIEHSHINVTATDNKMLGTGVKNILAQYI